MKKIFRISSIIASFAVVAFILLTVVNAQSLVVKHGLVEPSLQQAKAEVAYQFEREGYYCADNKDSSADKLVFNRTVGLRDSWGKEEE